MKILFLSSEAAPFAKIGGLGDVAVSLPDKLNSLGNEVIQVIPFHKSVNLRNYEVTQILSSSISHKNGDAAIREDMLRSVMDQINKMIKRHSDET